MTKVETLNKRLIEARKTRNNLEKNLLLTFKGEYENSVKNGKSDGDELIESIAKKMIKNAETIGNEDSKKEIEVLSIFMPEMMSEEMITQMVAHIIASSPGLNMGSYMGMVMKSNKNNIDAKIVSKVIKKLTTV